MWRIASNGPPSASGLRRRRHWRIGAQDRRQKGSRPDPRLQNNDVGMQARLRQAKLLRTGGTSYVYAPNLPPHSSGATLLLTLVASAESPPRAWLSDW
ncbi:hypothetical protein KC345_g246 [Hortaea werneckii]|nr:hypothetical protein KC345_g246 [Hortaea werneckii]